MIFINPGKTEMARHLQIAPRAASIYLLLLTVLLILILAVIRNDSSFLTPLGELHLHHPPLTHLWGQYSPFYSVASEISVEIPSDCNVSFVQVLSRHGSRDPTASRSASYNQTIAKIHERTMGYSDEYAFLRSYEYSLRADDLTKFGEIEMYNSGVTFFNRYQCLTNRSTPFIRASGTGRVLSSAELFSQGYHAARRKKNVPDRHPDNILVIGEYSGFNNTLNHGLCTNFETFPLNSTARYAQAAWIAKNFQISLVLQRINSNLRGANLSPLDLINLMDLCPLVTVSSANGTLAPFCSLFSYEEWRQYEYFQDLGKYYGYGSGNPLGPTQGVGFANELIARITNSKVHDHTSVNHTLDSSPRTFPLGRSLYADFSHDNDMTSVFFALGLYHSLPDYPSSEGPAKVDQSYRGYSASTTVSFAARAYVEKLVCERSNEELVRVIVNDRVVPLSSCDADALGRCTLTAFVESLGFARRGGDWDKCTIDLTEILPQWYADALSRCTHQEVMGSLELDNTGEGQDRCFG